jgi:hypothetical protein
MTFWNAVRTFWNYDRPLGGKRAKKPLDKENYHRYQIDRSSSDFDKPFGGCERISSWKRAIFVAKQRIRIL